MQPRERTFDYPAVFAEAAAVLCSAFCNNRHDPAILQLLPVRVRVIPAICVGRRGTALGASGFSRHGWNGINQRNQLGDVVAIGRSENGGQWNAIRIGEHVMLRAGLGAIRRVGASLGPPKTARTLALSAMARDQSMSSAPCNPLRSAWWMSCHTPASCQSRSRRQQVMPEPQAISRGRYSQGMPVFSTNRMPVSALRFSIGGRPPLGYVRGGGRMGSIAFQSSSVSSGLAMSPSSMTDNRSCPLNYHRLRLTESLRFC